MAPSLLDLCPVRTDRRLINSIHHHLCDENEEVLGDEGEVCWNTTESVLEGTLT